MREENLQNGNKEEYNGRYYSVRKIDENRYRYWNVNESLEHSHFHSFIHATNPISVAIGDGDEIRELRERSFVSKLSAIGYLLSPKEEGEEQYIVFGAPHPSNKEQGCIGLSLFGSVLRHKQKGKEEWIRGCRVAFRSVLNRLKNVKLLVIDGIVWTLRMNTFMKFINSTEMQESCAKIYANSSETIFIEQAKNDNRFMILYFGEMWRKHPDNSDETKTMEEDPHLETIVEDCIGIYKTFGLIDASK